MIDAGAPALGVLAFVRAARVHPGEAPCGLLDSRTLTRLGSWSGRSRTGNVQSRSIIGDLQNAEVRNRRDTAVVCDKCPTAFAERSCDL